MNTSTSETSRPAPRTYEVRTYGCQMNVHDSERLSGLLEDAGYVARPTDEQADVVVFNTCAVRENADNRLYGNLGHLAPVKAAAPGHADRRRRLPGAEGPREITAQGAVGRRGLRHAQHRLAAGAARARAGRRRRRRSRSSSRSRSSRPRCRPGASRRTRRGSRSRSAATTPARSASSRRCAARRRTAGPGDVLAEVAALVAEGVLEITLLGQNVNAYGVEFGDRQAFSQAAARVRRHRGAGAGAVHQPAPGGLHRRRHRGDGRDAERDAAAAHAAAVRLRPACSRAMRRSYRQDALPRHHRAGARRDPRRGDHDRHHRRLPGRDRGGLRGRPSTSSAQARFANAFTFQYSKRPGHAGRRPGRPDPARRSCRSATSGSSRSSGRDLLGGEPAVRRPPRRGAGRRGRGAQGRRHAPALRPRARQPARALRDGPRARARGRSGPATSSTVEITYAAPHHLVADGAVLGVRRTRAGDAWEARTARAAPSARRECCSACRRSARRSALTALLAAAAFCPSPPSFIPLVAADSAERRPRSRNACRRTMRRRACAPTCRAFIAVGDATAHRRVPANARGTVAGFGVDDVLGRRDRPIERRWSRTRRLAAGRSGRQRPAGAVSAPR